MCAPPASTRAADVVVNDPGVNGTGGYTPQECTLRGGRR